MIRKNVFCVTGGTGFLGRHLIHYLSQDSGNKIKFLSRQETNIFSSLSNVEQHIGDLLDPHSMFGFMEKGCILIHLAYLKTGTIENNLSVTKNLLLLSEKAKIERFLHCSTAVVVGKSWSKWIDESTKCTPSNDYERTKLDIERILLEKHNLSFNIAVLRPTAVFGEYGNNPNVLIDKLNKGSAFKNYLRKILFSNRRLNLICVKNVVGALSFLATTECVIDKEVFLISDDKNDANNFRFVASEVEKAFNIPVLNIPVLRISKIFFFLALLVKGRISEVPYRCYSSEKIRSIGYRSKSSFPDAFREYLRIYKNKL